MRILIRIRAAIERRGLLNRKEVSIRVRKTMLVLKRGLAQEREETKAMLITYQRYTKGLASEAEMREANEQFKDVIRGLGLSVVAILPFSPITIPAIVKLGEKIGVEVIPSGFKNMEEAIEADKPDLENKQTRISQ
ncbi:MAG: hypothetical protein GJ680_20670 [Alteromonadaceae bacterium]|nr:hypothetical protein [Alteromonadaceae bacterium]